MGNSILIIDDEPSILMMTSSRLKANGYDVKSLSDGRMLMETLNNFKPNLILLDVMMPPPDGLTLCKQIKSSNDFNQIPVLLFTAKSTREDINEIMQSGADGFVTKPYDANTLISKIKSFIT